MVKVFSWDAGKHDFCQCAAFQNSQRVKGEEPEHNGLRCIVGQHQIPLEKAEIAVVFFIKNKIRSFEADLLCLGDKI